MCSMALLSTLPYVHLTAFVFSIIAFAYFTQYHLYVCLFQQREPFQLLVAFTDILCSVFWIWYDGRYSGRPEISGRLRSPKAIYLFKNFFFEGMANYFSLKVIISSSFVIKSEQEFLTKEYRPPRVDMRDPNNQYMFSFHPHGVFPGTAIYGPKTNLWDHTVGYNSKTTVTTHCADIVFSVPLMREFPPVDVGDEC
ncbi:hypothetical protein ADEAN_000290700 [Angomonas deanei]|uniref:Diacylglycerol acyltransferase n=1 Tax=Angomonas deanei TaxID=59799 RepID=A0A7G2CBN3_9TRYP|nr:hypothetical protein ADEAN_000290700 [Angomonas deanei]